MKKVLSVMFLVAFSFVVTSTANAQVYINNNSAYNPYSWGGNFGGYNNFGGYFGGYNNLVTYQPIFNPVGFNGYNNFGFYNPYNINGLYNPFMPAPFGMNYFGYGMGGNFFW